MYEHLNDKKLSYPENLFSAIYSLPIPMHVDHDGSTRKKILALVESKGDSVLSIKKTLTVRHKDIILRVFKHYETYDTISKAYDITKERVRQILNEGIWFVCKEFH